MIWHFGTIFPCKFPKRNTFFLIGIHSMWGWTTTARHGVTRKRSTKGLKHTENLFIKPYPKTRKTKPSDSFLHLREASLDTRWQIEHFRLFFVFLVAGLLDLGWESLNFSNIWNTKKEMQLYPKIASRQEKHLLRAKSKTENFGLFALYPCYFFICCFAAPWLTFGSLLRKKSHSPDDHCIWSINFCSKGNSEVLGLYS